jgi:hypothetical protein
MLSEVFWVAFITTMSGMIIKLCSMAYKSKCKEASICCIKVVRDTEAEEKEEEFRITHPPQKIPESESKDNMA